MSFEINDKVKHNKYGLGIVKKDVTKICKDNEVLVTFDEYLLFLKMTLIFKNYKKGKFNNETYSMLW